MSKTEIKIGVRDLLETVFLPKDLHAALFAAVRGQEGTEGHMLLLSRRKLPGYRSEVPVEFPYETPEYRLIVRGRIDGLQETEDGLWVEEIKTTYTPVDDISPYPVHQAQLQLYVYFLMALHPDRRVEGKLTYLNLDDLAERSFPLTISQEAGEEFFRSLADTYLSTRRGQDAWRLIRNKSLQELEFPFHNPRPGQEELMETVTQALEQERDILVEAATGIGKTIAVLYPSLKQMAESDRFSQIFFLTAKTAGKEILKKTLLASHSKGLRLRTVFIEAKERVCLCPGTRCNPKNCIYAVNYYTKAQSVIPSLLEHELITPDMVLETAKISEACPFELSLDLSLQTDLIVCDYNYVFDPGVYLRRFFANTNRRDFLFLVDEAHNLVSRGREMYSATLTRQMLSIIGRECETAYPRIYTAIQAAERFFVQWEQSLKMENRIVSKLSHLPDLFPPALEKVAAEIELALKQPFTGPIRERLQDFFFELSAFNRIASLVNDDYAIYIKLEDGTGDLILRLFCLHPGALLRERLNHGRSAVFFSATLSPHPYFQELLGAGSDALSLRLTSPFPQETRLYLHVPGIDTRYRVRNQTANALAQCIADLALVHTGNYLVFFPSYTYLQAVLPLVKPLLAGKASIISQFPSMKESQKREFLRRITAVNTGHSNVGLAVLGGLFGEGVDFPGDELVGVVIVGPGIPMVNEEQELIRLYFDERNGQGYLYAYLIPGLIRVIQSAGRVFRTPEDKGVVLLIDDRFLQETYQELLPPDWFMSGRSFSTADYREMLEEFWEE